MIKQRSLYEDEVADYASTRFPPPRPFQKTTHERLREGRRAGHRCQLIMAPTGAGKTYLGLNLIQQALAKGRTAAFVCDRTTLINQTSAKADEYGLSAHGVIQADHWRTDRSFPFQICSAQSLEGRGYPHADLVVVDEAHTQLSAWTAWLKRAKETTFVGLTATPFSKGLGKLFSNLINAATMDELTRSGVLVPLRVMQGTPTDMRGAETSDGEWTDKAATDRGMAIVGDVVSEWVKYGEDRKTICFGSTVKHCEELCAQFVKAGIMAALFTGHTPEEERKDLLDEFTKADSSLRVLISVEALAKGFDVPDVSCVIDCRPLRKSLSTVIQMWGRGLRSYPGKVDCLLMDHSGNSERFKEDFIKVFFDGLESLDSGEKLDATVRKEPPEDAPPAKGCPKCGYKPFLRRCMRCSHEVEVAATVEHQPGEMKEVQLTRGKTIDKQQLYQECVAYARLNSAAEKQKGRAGHLYREITGSPDWPSSSWFNAVPADVQVSQAVRSKIISLNIKRVKRREKAGAEA